MIRRLIIAACVLMTDLDGSADEAGPVRFVALGDAGEGNGAQYEVGDAIGEVCAARGCDFALYLGDNFYPDGVDSIEDGQFRSKFEEPYAHLDFPFFVVNGNHDVDDDWKSSIYVAYTDRSDKWTMPARYYRWSWGDVELFGLDTSLLVDHDPTQASWLEDALESSSASWKIVFGHHPWRSNGSHGDADGTLDSALDEALCGRASVYLAGHDHTLQWLERECGVEILVSGAGAKTTSLGDRSNHAYFEDDDRVGFLYVEIDGDELTGTFFDRYADELFTRSVTR